MFYNLDANKSVSEKQVFLKREDLKRRRPGVVRRCRGGGAADAERRLDANASREKLLIRGKNHQRGRNHRGEGEEGGSVDRSHFSPRSRLHGS